MKFFIILAFLFCATAAFPEVNIGDVVSTMKIGLEAITGTPKARLFTFHHGSEYLEEVRDFESVLHTKFHVFSPTMIYLDGKFWSNDRFSIPHGTHHFKYESGGKSFTWTRGDMYLIRNNPDDVVYMQYMNGTILTHPESHLTRISNLKEITELIPNYHLVFLENQFFRLDILGADVFLSKKSGYVRRSEMDEVDRRLTHLMTARAILTRTSYTKMFDVYVINPQDVADAYDFLVRTQGQFDTEDYRRLTSTFWPEHISSLPKCGTDTDCIVKNLEFSDRRIITKYRNIKIIDDFFKKNNITISPPVLHDEWDGDGNIQWESEGEVEDYDYVESEVDESEVDESEVDESEVEESEVEESEVEESEVEESEVEESEVDESEVDESEVEEEYVEESEVGESEDGEVLIKFPKSKYSVVKQTIDEYSKSPSKCADIKIEVLSETVKVSYTSLDDTCSLATLKAKLNLQLAAHEVFEAARNFSAQIGSV